MNFDIDREDWPAGDWETLSENAAVASGEVAAELANPRLMTSLLFTSDEQVRTLNREWRERDTPTNVLSFPMLTRDEILELAGEGPPVMLGDIALAHGTCAREAEAKGISLSGHAAHLIVHGLLHLAGYEHETSDADAEAMESLEIRILAKMGLSDPYGDHNKNGV